jgi:tRNA pseudouridine55 synthase
MNGVIIIDKPAGWTSHDVVNRMRRILGQRSVGHLGTLDPLATGVLPLVTGNLTRLAQFYTTSEKTYEGVIRFGFATNTYDADGEPLEPQMAPDSPVHVGTAALACPEPVERSCPSGRRPDLNLGTLQQLATKFHGLIEQTPPPFSAKKVNGVPAYKLARKQQDVILKPVQVEIKEFTILSLDNDRAHFRARVASGTYMRSVAHDMGRLLGSGAHLESLRRTSVAEFDIAQAHTIEEVETRIAESKIAQPPSICHSERVRANASASRRIPTPASQTNPCHSEPGGKPGEEPAVLFSAHEDRESTINAGAKSFSSLFIHPRQLLPQFPSVTADEPTAARIRNGRPVNLPDVSRARRVKVFAGQADLLAIATRVAGTLFHPKIVFPCE